MCGRFTNTASPDELMRLFGVTVMDNLQPRWNVAPSQSALVIIRQGFSLRRSCLNGDFRLPPKAGLFDKRPNGNSS